MLFERYLKRWVSLMMQICISSYRPFFLLFKRIALKEMHDILVFAIMYVPKDNKTNTPG